MDLTRLIPGLTFYTDVFFFPVSPGFLEDVPFDFYKRCHRN